MTNTYFEYALSNCKSQVIKRVCERYSTKGKLIESVENEWGDYRRIISDRAVLQAIQTLFGSRGILDESFYSADSLVLYERCASVYSEIMCSWRKENAIEYERLFNSLIDICWLIASTYSSNTRKERYVILLSDQNIIHDSIRSFLESVYETAISDHNEGVYISEGINAKKEHLFFPWLYDNRFDQSMYYIRSDMTSRDLQYRKDEYVMDCRTRLSIYYSLTATAALAENIRRFG